MTDLKEIIATTERYNFHSHTEFCDGRFPMTEMAAAAVKCGMEHYGFSPHSPVPVQSPCNMRREDVAKYLETAGELRERYAGECCFHTSMEIDYMGADWGPRHDYFQRLPLDYRIGSVHFVPNQDGIPVDCDGSYERFARNLKDAYGGDIRYVVEKYFEQVITMTEYGGFEMLGHLDKIAANASQAQPGIEDEEWYHGLVSHVLDLAADKGLVVEINTKAYEGKDRFFPAVKWWPQLIVRNLPLAVNSDAHYTDRITSGREEALRTLRQLRDRQA